MTVLLVDDESDVRRLVGRLLIRHGFSLLEATGGPEAIQVSEEHQGPIHLLLTDVVMPGMSGRDLAQQLEPMRPEMRVLFMSGRVDESFLQEGGKFTSCFIGKPFTPDALIGKVQDVLGLRGYASTG